MPPSFSTSSMIWPPRPPLAGWRRWTPPRRGSASVVGVPEPSPAALATAPVWCMATDRSWRQLADIVDSAAGSGR